ncbi:hypothetical protein ASF84_23085 [Pseudomonas sp. Leaf127]|uniref:hypothetical protein n=1 Tax=Pseudomonas sp. Leaf127 TaxID=1736267 RepID=UPI0007028AD1|nr:hypothetical protein [Pseudomonas sp. Leaf127]KQQ49196.1 hypothetical protein ASF84_23085 [Pseudomonas sp. Leaf127]
MALDIIIRKREGATSRHEFPEGLHQSLFRKDVKIKKNNILFPLKDYYLTDCSFRGDDIPKLIAALESAKSRLPEDQVQALENVLTALTEVDAAEVSFAGD